MLCIFDCADALGATPRRYGTPKDDIHLKRCDERWVSGVRRSGQPELENATVRWTGAGETRRVSTCDAPQDRSWRNPKGFDYCP
jgi:hypothetical protein